MDLRVERQWRTQAIGTGNKERGLRNNLTRQVQAIENKKSVENSVPIACVTFQYFSLCLNTSHTPSHRLKSIACIIFRSCASQACASGLSATMDCKIPRDSQMSSLREIQKIPCDIADKKWSWIDFALDQRGSRTTSTRIATYTSRRKKRRHEDVTSALKCEDLTIINRAFKAS